MVFFVIHLLSFLLLSSPTISEAATQTGQPHIILIYADDLGWNDVSFHGSPEVPTPNIDALAQSGILLNNYYGEWVCTPSRAALLTGKYPIYLGLQHSAIKVGERTGLPLNETLLPQYLQELGYETHIVGKWHLGYYLKEFMPTYRGFVSSVVFLNGDLDYYDYTNNNDGFIKLNPTDRAFFGVDLYNGTELIKDFRKQYAVEFFTEKARDVILNHDTAKPLFLYFAQIAVHGSASTQALQAPPEEVKKFMYIKDKNRRIYAGKTATLDQSLGIVVEALSQKNMLNDSIILFLSDNGAELVKDIGGYGTNYPLRGKKQTLWEGGVRLPAIVWSPLFQQPRISDQLIHVTDWLPTLYRAAGGDPSDLGNINGIDQWEVFTSNAPSSRTDLLLNIDPVYGVSSYRNGDLKVINGTTGEGYDMWYGPSGFENLSAPPSMEEWIFKNGSIVRDILMEIGMWNVEDPDEWYSQSTIICEQPPPDTAYNCDAAKAPCLFNVTSDPCEYVNLANDNPEIVNSMMNVINDYQKGAMKPQSKTADPRADPMCHNFAYVPWMEPEHYNECDYLS